LVTSYGWPSATAYCNGDVIPHELVTGLEPAARTLLVSARAEIESLGASVAGVHAHQGPVFEVIANVATRVAADLIIVGSRELTGLKRLLVGSVSGNVVCTAHRPVLIVRGGEHAWPPSDVIVGFDHSPEARRAARIAAAIARLYIGVNMRLVEAVPASARVETDRLTFGDLLETEHGHLERNAERLSRLAGHSVKAEVVVGEPADALLAHGANLAGAGLVAVGTRGHGSVRRFLLGSVSTKILHSGHTPLLVVPGSAAGNEPREEDDA
jgi:nucleotide-binding universal stress UspA family protein